ncbi:hypothetical protein, partial [Yersinia enterocolitica]|uniref:hypothetical protein n=2 Tax=Gammaproteobacteria TaxID=1236 RepID=UPI00338EAA75
AMIDLSSIYFFSLSLGDSADTGEKYRNALSEVGTLRDVVHNLRHLVINRGGGLEADDLTDTRDRQITRGRRKIDMVGLIVVLNVDVAHIALRC